MKQAKLRMTSPAAVSVPERDIRALLASGNGEAALLYLHILQNGGTYDEERAATELHRSDREIARSAERLCRMGLLSEEGGADAAPLKAPREELPAYSRQDVVRRGRESPEFTALVDAVQIELGRLLSPSDTAKLLGIYDDLALPGDVILVLIRYCRQEHERRYGKGKSLGFAYIEKAAYAWFNSEIVTCEQAEQWVEERARRRTAAESIKRVLGIRDRELTASESRYIDGWLERGFAEEAVAIAYDRTVTNTGGLKWKYMDSIIRSWDEKGLHTAEEIEAGDTRPNKPAGQGKFTAVTAPTKDDAKTMEQLNRLLEKMENS